MLEVRPPVVLVASVLLWLLGCYLGDLSGVELADRLLDGHYLSQGSVCGRLTGHVILLMQACCSWFPLLFVCGVIAALPGALSGSRATAWTLFLIPSLALLYTLMRLPAPASEDLCALFAGERVVVVTRVERRMSDTKYEVAHICVRYPAGCLVNGRSLLVLRGCHNQPPLRIGATVEIVSRVARIRQVSCSWRRDRKRGLYLRGIFSRLTAYANGVRLLENPPGSPGWSTAVENARGSIIEFHRSTLGRLKGDLLSSMVLGDRTVDLDSDLRETFRKVGLSHLLAASGFNLSILAGATFLLTSALFRSRLATGLLTICVTLGFVALAGPSPSVVRAALMCSVLVISNICRRRAHSGAVLAATLIVYMIIDPACLLDVGLQLSYAATASIVFGLPAATSLLGDLRGVGRLTRWSVDVIIVIVLAHLGVLPVQLVHFHCLGLLFLPANLACEPVVASITVCGFMSSVLVLITEIAPPAACAILSVAGVADSISCLPLEYMIAVARFLASFPFSVVPAGQPSVFCCISYVICLALAYLLGARRALRLPACIVLVTGVCLLAAGCYAVEPVVGFFGTRHLVIVGKAGDSGGRATAGERPAYVIERFLSFNGVGGVTSLPDPMALSRPGTLDGATARLRVITLGRTRLVVSSRGESLVALSAAQWSSLSVASLQQGFDRITIVWVKARRTRLQRVASNVYLAHVAPTGQLVVRSAGALASRLSKHDGKYGVDATDKRLSTAQPSVLSALFGRYRRVYRAGSLEVLM